MAALAGQSTKEGPSLCYVLCDQRLSIYLELFKPEPELPSLKPRGELTSP